MAPVLASVSVVALSTSGALAQSVIDYNRTGEYYVSFDEDITVTEDGALRLLGNNGDAALYVDIADYQSDIVNDGSIELLQVDDTSAAAIWLTGDLSGSITNNGTIDATVLNDTTSASANGIYVAGTVYGSIDNTGTIDATAAVDSYTALAFGVAVGTVAEGGSITNSGSITVDARATSESDATAYGIYVDSSSDGTITNTSTGVIDVRAFSSTSEAWAYGIYVDGDVGETGLIENAGVIKVDASTGDSSTASAYGIYVGGSLYGAIDNSGDIEVSAAAGTSYAYAYGIYVSDYLDTSASITNSGSIKADATTITDSSASAYGIYVGGTVDGDVTNSGSIEVKALSATYSASAYGIYVGGDVNGSVTNTDTGVITVEADTATGEAEAYGLYVSGDMYGTIDNAGLIDVLAQGVSSSASAYGIYVSGGVDGLIDNSGTIKVEAQSNTDDATGYGIRTGSLFEGGVIDNSGLITVLANSDDSSATGYGIYVSGDMSGLIDNSGDINVEATASDSASAYGIYVSGNLYGMIDNSGSITTHADSNGDTESNASSFGVYLSGTLYGTIDNSGTIDSSANSDYSTPYAYGMYINNGVADTGVIDNSGDIIVDSYSSGSDAYSHGIDVNGSVAGWIDNSGTITVSASTYSSDAYAYGISADTLAWNGTIDNSGTIDVSASTNWESTGYAYGIDIGTLDGVIDNSGQILVYAESYSSDANAYGINVSDVGADGQIYNSGSIEVSANADDTASATGVHLTNMHGLFDNSGSIVAHEDGGLGVAIDASNNDYSNDGLVVLNSNGFIEGEILVYGNLDVDVVGRTGGSVHWTATDLGGGEGGPSFWANETDYAGVPVFTYDLGGANPEYATFDASGIAAVRQGSADSGFIGVESLFSQTQQSVGKPAQVTQGAGGAGGFKPFVSGASKSATYAGGDITMEQDVTTTALTVGATKSTDGGLAFGLAAGALNGSATVDNQGAQFDAGFETSSDSSSNGAFAAVSLAGSNGSLNFAGALSAGSLQFDNTRYTNDNTVYGGIVSNLSTFDSTFVAAQLGVSGRFDMGNGMALVPNTTLRYAQHSIDGYEENTLAGAVVESQSFGVFEGEIGVTLEKAMGSGVVSGGISMVSRSFSGDDAALVHMIGDTNLVSADANSASAAKISIGFTAGVVGATQFNIGAETLVGSDGMSGGKVSGEIRFSF